MVGAYYATVVGTFFVSYCTCGFGKKVVAYAYLWYKLTRFIPVSCLSSESYEYVWCRFIPCRYLYFSICQKWGEGGCIQVHLFTQGVISRVYKDHFLFSCDHCVAALCSHKSSEVW